MTITVELELSSPYDLTAEEVENDLRKGEDMIGFVYDYVIKSVEVKEYPHGPQLRRHDSRLRFHPSRNLGETGKGTPRTE